MIMFKSRNIWKHDRAKPARGRRGRGGRGCCRGGLARKALEGQRRDMARLDFFKLALTVSEDSTTEWAGGHPCGNWVRNHGDVGVGNGRAWRKVGDSLWKNLEDKLGKSWCWGSEGREGRTSRGTLRFGAWRGHLEDKNDHFAFSRCLVTLGTTRILPL